VKPIVDLFKASFAEGKGNGPSRSDIDRALSHVGAENIKIRGRNIAFKKPGMGITLDGIAKGYIVDRASQVLSDHGIDNHLINAGGDIRTSGEKDDKRPWTVAIQDPFKKSNYPDILKMKNGAVATSGNYEVFFDREKMFHHIVNPETGLSPALNTSVSLLAETAMEADALATGVFVMPPRAGIAFVNSLSPCEGLVIGKDGGQLKSRGWKSRAI
jgi:thiamine biosynthesis lipoprotein